MYTYLSHSNQTWNDWLRQLERGKGKGSRSLLRSKRQTQQDLRAVRKEYRQFTDDERVRFQQALNKLKYDKIDTKSKYDLLIIYHTPSESPGAHWGPAFLPLHREWLKQYATVNSRHALQTGNRPAPH